MEGLPFLIATLIMTLTLRLYMFRKFKKRNPEGDEISHLMMLKSVQENEGRIPEKINRFLLNHNDYPNGFHKLIAMLRLPLSFWDQYGGFLPIGFDVLQLLWIYLFVQLTGGHDFMWLLCFPLIRILWSREARSNDFGERAFGGLVGNIYLGSVFIYMTLDVWYWLPVAFLTFALCSCASKFGNQAMLFFTLIISLCTLNILPLAIYGACFLLTALITRGYLLKVIRGQILYSNHYRHHRIQRVWQRGFYKDFFSSLFRFKWMRFKFFFFENPLFMLLTNCPVNFAFLAFWAFQSFELTPLAAYAQCGNILALLIALKPLRFLGQPERYLEFSLPALFSYLSLFSAVSYWPVFLLMVLLGVLTAYYQFNIKLKEHPDYLPRRKSYTRLRKFLSQQPDSVILTIPLKCSNYLAYRLPRHRYVACFTHCESKNQYEEYQQLIPDYYPFPGPNLSQYIEQYRVQFMIQLKSSVAFLNQRTQSEYYNFNPFPVVFENDDFIVYATT